MSPERTGSRGAVPVRRIELVRAGWGAALLLAPRFVLTRVHRVDIDARSVVITRVLGARHLTQALLSGVHPSPEVLAMGVWVDAAHAATALGLAAADRARAPAGVTDALVAGGWSLVGHRDLRRTSATPASHDRVRDHLACAVLGVVPGGRRLRRLAETDRARPARQETS